MKRCPACDKTFPDAMKFCQTDGTLLVEDTPAVDPYKTVVGNQSDIASPTPPVDPFKTMVAIPPLKPGDDLLQLPEEPDSLKTMIVSQEELLGELNLKDDAPPLYAPSAPLIEPKPAAPKDFAPEPPKFNEPSLSPPSFGDLSSPSADAPKSFESNPNDATAIMDSGSLKENIPPSPFDAPKPSSPFDSKPSAPSPFDSKPPDYSGKPSYGSQGNKPIPSPFDGSMIGYQPPAAPPPAAPPKPPPVKEAEPPSPSGNYQEPANTPFQPPSPFGAAADPFSQPASPAEWTPPPAPVSEWQNQDLGANTPFQPPGAAMGQDKTLATVALVCGILSIPCCGLFTGIPAIITGFMAKSRADAEPNTYTGRGLAIAGIITGAIGTVLSILGIILQIVLGGLNRF